MANNGFMSDEEFDLLRGFIRKEFGILLKGDKKLTLHAKISHRLPILGLSSYRDYCDFITSDASKEEMCVLASHITNCETYFFREKAQLDVFSDLLSDLKRERLNRGQKKLRVLSLGCSSGEEPYSLNIILLESGLFMWDWDIRITGVDLNREAIKKAVEAVYTKNSFRGFNGNGEPIRKYFIPVEKSYFLKRAFTKNVDFIHGNLLERDSFSGLDDIDVIFCRNMLIYMDDAIEKVARNIYDSLSDTGYLFIGSSESLIQRTNLFVPQYYKGVIVYRKNVKD